ncbi:DNA helicase RecQ, partial [Lawsonibacter sp. DFI.5.51]|nr:DNA helicase RecQ [Lawsonibacter sp. DFI.5.51]
ESGIIYAATRKEVDKIYEGLNKRGYNVSRYHAGLGAEERKLNQESFIKDDVSVMVATNAFGMGIDKPNIRYVIHYN